MAIILKLLPLFQYNYFKLCTFYRQSLFKITATIFSTVNSFYYISTVIVNQLNHGKSKTT